MIEKHVAAQQVERLSGLDWYPREAAALHELILAAQSAYNEFVLNHVLTEWLSTQREAPKPADLRRLIWDENEKQEKPKSSRSQCRECGGSGWISQSKVYEGPAVWMQGMDYEYSVPCPSCR